MAVPAARGHVHLTRALASAHLEGNRSRYPAAYGLSRRMAAVHRQSLLYGRPPAPLGPGDSYVGRVFDRRVSGRDAEDQHHPFERRLLPPQWRAFQRPGDSDAILDPARRYSDLGHDRL